MKAAVWKVLGNAVTGTSHELSGDGCQDSYGWRIGPEAVALAVADGAGSRAHSHLGSRAAIVAALDWAGEIPPEGDSPAFADAVRYVRQELRTLARRVPCEFDSLATTLGMVLVGSETVEVGQVGDTIILLRLTDGTYLIPSPHESFEYVNQTVFVTDDAAVTHLRIDSFPADSVSGIALSTDGLRFKILKDLSTHEPFVPFFEDVFSYTATEGSNDAAVARFLSNLDDQSGDDKTLLIGVRESDRLQSEPPRIVVGPGGPADGTSTIFAPPASG